MTLEQAQTLKNKVEELNKLYAPITLSFDMFRNPKEDHDSNWFVTIVYHVVPDDWFTFVSLGFNLSLIHISEPTRQAESRMPSSA